MGSTVVALSGLLCAAGGASAAPSVVVLDAAADPAAVAARHGLSPGHVYESALVGFAADVPAARLGALRADPAVRSVRPDGLRRYRALAGGVAQFDVPALGFAQVSARGLRRTGAQRNPIARIDGVDERVDVDIAILDSGIQSDHPDLNVVGGVDCVSGRSSDDRNGHGTFIAGIAGALDNGFGVVGVAPGARLWAVRVLNTRGVGSDSAILCGIDWVTANAATIEVANMSLGKAGRSDDDCGRVSGEAMHAALCRSVAAGVTYTAAAGNESADVAGTIPAAYPEVIAVAALADSDGQPGGVGGPDPCLDEPDDVLASFSNFGSRIALAAPGVCIGSTTLGSGVGTRSGGTSFASPFVAGAAALLLANPARPDSPSGAGSARVAAVRRSLVGGPFLGASAIPELDASGAASALAVPSS